MWSTSSSICTFIVFRSIGLWIFYWYKILQPYEWWTESPQVLCSEPPALFTEKTKKLKYFIIKQTSFTFNFQGIDPSIPTKNIVTRAKYNPVYVKDSFRRQPIIAKIISGAAMHVFVTQIDDIMGVVVPNASGPGYLFTVQSCSRNFQKHFRGWGTWL